MIAGGSTCEFRTYSRRPCALPATATFRYILTDSSRQRKKLRPRAPRVVRFAIGIVVLAELLDLDPVRPLLWEPPL